MVYRISKKNKTLKGIVRLTPSKSISNRLLIIRALCKESFPVHQLATADDTLLLQKLLNSTSETRNAENAGTVFRFLTAYLALQQDTYLLTGTERMKERPIGALVDALRKLGAEISYAGKENFPPLRIRGKKLTGGSIEIDGSASSQFISSLLMIAPVLEEGLILKLTGEPSSVPYIKMTLELMKLFGIHSEWIENKIRIAHQDYIAATSAVEKDWSAASYWYEMAAMADEVDLMFEGLHAGSIQGDSEIAGMMEAFGIKTEFNRDGARITKKNKSSAPAFQFSRNLQAHPDLVPALALTCAALSVDGNFSGVQNLRIKESDRLLSLQTELKKMGVDVEITKDELRISKSEKIHPSTSPFSTYNDHRMAMSFAPLALKFGTVEIENPVVVKKSYPEYWDDLKAVGFEIREV